MANISDFRTWVEVSCEGANRALVDDAILIACDRFLRYTGLWSTEHAGIQLVAGTSSYNLTAPTNAVLCRIENARYKSQPLAPADAAYGKSYTGGYAPFAFWLEPPLAIAIAPAPSGTLDATDVLNCRAIWTVSVSPVAAAVPDFLLHDYRRAIVDGALAELFRIPGKGWSDVNEAKAREKEFKAACAGGRIRAATGNTNNVLPPDYPPTA